jgi:molybdopterin converting factor small subunit
MRIHLGGHLDWYHPEKRSWLELKVERPVALAELAQRMGVPLDEIALVVVNRRLADLATETAGDADTVEFFPPIDGG